MDAELRMRLADIGEPSALAECITDYFPDMPIPVPLEEIAEAVGITSLTTVSTTNFEGVLITDAAKTKGSIAVNANSPLERQRFTIAHEIGHFLIVTHTHTAQCVRTDLSVMASSDAGRAKEAEANRFASHLLMPKRRFLADIRKLGQYEVSHIVQLASRYQVSKEAAARRFTGVSQTDCAVIFSHNGLVRGVCSSKAFPFVNVRKGDRLPPRSRSSSSGLAVGSASDWTEHETDVWLGKHLRGKLIYEQFLQQANGYGMTLLTLDDADDVSADDDDDEDDEWEKRQIRR